MIVVLGSWLPETLKKSQGTKNKEKKQDGWRYLTAETGTGAVVFNVSGELELDPLFTGVTQDHQKMQIFTL